jgi:hypothetical protein
MPVDFLIQVLLRVQRATLHLYPREFRQRFGGEMSQTFGDRLRAVTSNGAVFRLVLHIAADTIHSALREHTAGFPTGTTQPAPDGVPLFTSFGDDAPRPAALFYGGILAIATFAAISFLISHGGQRAMRLIGSHGGSPSHVVPAPTRAAGTDLDTQVKLRPAPDSNESVHPYFKSMPVLRALDSDHDGVLSAAEIAKASAVLRTLDLNRDAKLSVDECGLRLPDPSSNTRRLYMRLHPILNALDADGDGEISAAEIARAAAALRSLDISGDGMLTAPEVLPRNAAVLEAFRRSLLDDSLRK